MEAILARRYAFCDFSNIPGFPHPVPTITEWDDYLPRFRGNKNDHPAEHLLNFRKCMLEHKFVHEDVLIKMFRFSLEEHSREWCQSLPAASIHSLKDFYAAFKQRYSADLLLEECCMELEVQHVCNQEMVEEEVVPPDSKHVSHGYHSDISDEILDPIISKDILEDDIHDTSSFDDYLDVRLPVKFTANNFSEEHSLNEEVFVEDISDFILDVPVVTNLDEGDRINYGEIMFSESQEDNNSKVAHHFLQYTKDLDIYHVLKSDQQICENTQQICESNQQIYKNTQQICENSQFIIHDWLEPVYTSHVFEGSLINGENDDEGIKELSLEKYSIPVQEDHANPFIDQPIYDVHKPVTSIEEMHGEDQPIQYSVDCHKINHIAGFQKISQQDADLIAHDALIIKRDKILLQLLTCHDDIVVLEAAKTFPVQEINKWIQLNLVVLVSDKTNDFQIDYALINKAEITEQHICYLYQLSILHVFHDPVVDYMELFFTEDFTIAEPCMQLRYNCQFQLFIQVLLHTFLYFCNPLFCCKQSDDGVSHQFERLFWKSVYT